MADKKSFKHISVNDSSDDEVVIQAGAVHTPVHETAEEADTLPQQNAIDEADSSLFGDAFDAQTGLYPVTVDDDPEEEVEEASDETPATDSTGSASGDGAAAASARKDTYRETTLEDVESSKMGNMQKVVLAVAVLAIIAAIVWYVLR